MKPLWYVNLKSFFCLSSLKSPLLIKCMVWLSILKLPCLLTCLLTCPGFWPSWGQYDFFVLYRPCSHPSPQRDCFTKIGWVPYRKLSVNCKIAPDVLVVGEIVWHPLLSRWDVWSNNWIRHVITLAFCKAKPFYLLNYITRRSEKLEFQKEKKKTFSTAYFSSSKMSISKYCMTL